MALAPPANAIVIEVQAPEFAGIYSNSSRTATIHLPAPPSVIHGISVRVRGTTSLASYRCDGPGGYGPPQPVATQISGGLTANPGYWLMGHHNESAGAFDWTEPLVPVLGATWSFLLDGEGEMTIGEFGETPIMECTLVGPPNSTMVESVTLLVDGEFATPARKASWGQMKSIYR